MDEPKRRYFSPLFFRTQTVPSCAHTVVEELIARGPLNSDQIAFFEKCYPYVETVLPGSDGYRIKRHHIFTILSTDPKARLFISGNEFQIGEGSFSFPMIGCPYHLFILFHKGEVKLEYRDISRELLNILEWIEFNIIMHDKDGNRTIAAIQHGRLCTTDLPRQNILNPPNPLYTSKQILEWIELALTEKFLHYTPSDEEVVDLDRNLWDLENLRKDAKFFMYAYVGDKIHSIFVSVEENDESDIMIQVNSLEPAITSCKRIAVTDETWSFVEKHYDDDLTFDTDNKDDQKAMLEQGLINVHFPGSYIIRWGQ